MQANTTINGRCEEGLESDKKAIGAEVNGLPRWKYSSDADMKPPPNIAVPLMEMVWTSSFGMQIDQFGVPWMVNVAASGA